ncbi:MAG: isoprenyl transferase [Desulfobacteraceae bacterium]|nr:isoprenyl transferase [Desulfobacteraceae bacterium]
MHDLDFGRLPRHVAIIMDGNGRWAKQRLRNRIFGHEEGTSSVREVVKCCLDFNIPYLTLYAFSKENWQRPESEVKALWRLLMRFLKQEMQEMLEKGVRYRHLGDEEDIPGEALDLIRDAVARTARADRLVLGLAINYGGRQEIARAARLFAEDVLKGKARPGDLSPEVLGRYLFTADLPDPDLMIRTGGERRVSNFLPWQLTYSELYFTEVLWPDFRREHFIEALHDYQNRERRFGRTSEQVQEESR